MAVHTSERGQSPTPDSCMVSQTMSIVAVSDSRHPIVAAAQLDAILALLRRAATP